MSPHGTPTQSQWLDEYSSLSVTVESPTETVPNQTRWLCTGFSLDHAARQEGTDYMFYSIQEPHEIEFYWIHQFWLQINTNPTGLTQPIVSVGGPWYDNSTLVTCTAQKMSGYGFDHWTVDGISQDSRANSLMALMNSPHEVIACYLPDNVKPFISTPVCQPNCPNPAENVTVSVNVTDSGSGVGEVFLRYRIEGNGAWIEVNMTKLAGNTYAVEIPGFEGDTHVQYYVMAYDNAYNQAIQDNDGTYFHCTVVPEFQAFAFLLLFISLTLIIISLSKIRRKTAMNTESSNSKRT
jgi:hypothetical protein